MLISLPCLLAVGPAGCDGSGDVAVFGVTDTCPDDAEKLEPGVCGCGISDEDSDGDLFPDCIDSCAQDSGKTDLGTCGCGVAETDTDEDGLPDCVDLCPGEPDVDSDQDGWLDCDDGCPADPDKIVPGRCGCGIPELDSDGDGIPGCVDICPGFDDGLDVDGDTAPDGCDACPQEPALIFPDEPAEELSCADGIDNDCDGFTDGEDQDCHACRFTCGDLNGDGRSNLADFSRFAVCLNRRPLAIPGCACADLNEDGLVNMLDWAIMSILLGGSSVHYPPNCP